MNPDSELVVCPQCNYLHRLSPPVGSQAALCCRCRAPLWRKAGQSPSLLPLAVAAALGWLFACLLPVIGLNFQGSSKEMTLWQAAWLDPGEGHSLLLSVLSTFLIVVAPMTQILLIVWLSLFGQFQRKAPGFAAITSLLRTISPWSMPLVVAVGFLVVGIKLSTLLQVKPGAGAGALAASALLFFRLSARDLRPLWAAPSVPEQLAGNGQSWALLIAAMIFYLPANVLPVMFTSFLGTGSEKTIFEGIIEFWRSGSPGIALLIFLASMVIPFIKFLALGLLLLTSQRKSQWARRERDRLYRFTEWIGCWSMLDVFVVVIITGLVQFPGLSEAEPRPGIIYFALVVILTMLSAQRFRSQSIWEVTP